MNAPSVDIISVAVIGAGVAGAACAAGLRSAGAQVTVFDKSPRVGGRMASRRVEWVDGAGRTASTTFDHGTPWFTAAQPRFRAVVGRAVAAGRAAPWRPVVHGSRSMGPEARFVAVPAMRSLCEHLLEGSPLELERTVRRLQRAADGGWYVAADHAPLAGPFSHVVLALPPAQAALLLAGHHDDWAAALVDRRLLPCWTLMAVTDDVDWPWDAAEPARGPFARVLRNDRVPGREAPAGVAVWTAQASAAWSADHLDDDPKAVSDALRVALRAQLPATNVHGAAIAFHHVDVHRWRYASPAAVEAIDAAPHDDEQVVFDAALGLGVCGDWLAGGGVEAAWHSGDELADAMAYAIEQAETQADIEVGATIRPTAGPGDHPVSAERTTAAPALSL